MSRVQSWLRNSAKVMWQSRGSRAPSSGGLTREEACQSRQLLELYLQALKKEGSIVSKQQEFRADLGDERDAVDTSVRESSSKVTPASQILMVLKEKSAPE